MPLAAAGWLQPPQLSVGPPASAKTHEPLLRCTARRGSSVCSSATSDIGLPALRQTPRSRDAGTGWTLLAMEAEMPAIASTLLPLASAGLQLLLIAPRVPLVDRPRCWPRVEMAAEEVRTDSSDAHHHACLGTLAKRPD
eukprot:scaffold6818_cov103-Isochrysis_galbana.AAC.5